MTARSGLAALILVVGVVAMLVSIDRAEAASTDGVVLIASQGTPALAGVIPALETRTWEHADGGTQEIRSATGKAMYSFACVNLTHVPVYVGASGVTSSTGTPYCNSTTTCPSGTTWSYDARGAFMAWSGYASSNDAGVDGVRCNLGVQ